MQSIQSPNQSQSTPIVIPNYFAAEQTTGHCAQAMFTSLWRFIEHVKQHASEHSVLFVQRDLDEPVIVAVFNYHERDDDGCPRKRTQRACYHFSYASSWRSWMHAHECWMTPKEFGRFIKSRISDVVDPERAEQLVKEYMAAQGAKFATVEHLLGLSNFLEGFSDEQGGKCAHLDSPKGDERSPCAEHDEEAVRIPGHFLLALPVFMEGTTYQVGACIQADAREATKFSVALWKVEELVAHAIDEGWKTARRETGLPVIFGRPESQ